jgi:hypothetical protein
MKLAIMQPYFFPYIGYFQLVNAVDKFVFYDDVNFIKNGWINRNKILIHGKPAYFTVQLKEASSFKLINQIEFIENSQKLLKMIRAAYSKAPFFDDVFPVINDGLNVQTKMISELAIQSIQEVCNYLEINAVFEKSSQIYPETKHLSKTQRIQCICENNNADTYINAIGGTDLYSKPFFNNLNVELYFIQSMDIIYKQHENQFIPNLSIIDLMMFNSKNKLRDFLNSYVLI